MDLNWIRELLECQICLETLEAPIFTCEMGHAICKICIDKVDRCPTCRRSYRGSRNFIVEKLSEELERTLMMTKGKTGKGISPISGKPKYQAPLPPGQGLVPRASGSGIGNSAAAADADSDEFRPLNCGLPFDGCEGTEIDFFEYIDHLRNVHRVTYSTGSEFTKKFVVKAQQVVRGGSSKMFILNSQSRNFLITAHQVDEEVRIWAMLHGSNEEASQTQYLVKMSIYVGTPQNPFQPKTRIRFFLGNVLGIRTSALQVGSECLSIPSSEILNCIPKSDHQSFRVWFLKVTIVSAETMDNPPATRVPQPNPAAPSPYALRLAHADNYAPISIFELDGDEESNRPAEMFRDGPFRYDDGMTLLQERIQERVDRRMESLRRERASTAEAELHQAYEHLTAFESFMSTADDEIAGSIPLPEPTRFNSTSQNNNSSPATPPVLPDRFGHRLPAPRVPSATSVSSTPAGLPGYPSTNRNTNSTTPAAFWNSTFPSLAQESTTTNNSPRPSSNGIGRSHNNRSNESCNIS